MKTLFLILTLMWSLLSFAEQTEVLESTTTVSEEQELSELEKRAAESATETLPLKEQNLAQDAKVEDSSAQATALAEDRVPLDIAAKAVKSADIESPFVRLLGLTLLGACLCLGLFFYLRKRQKTKIAPNNIKILSQTFIGPKKSLAVVQVAGESILIGVTDHNISLLKTLSLMDEEIPESTPAKFGPVMHASSHLDGLMDQEEDTFEYHGLKNDVVKKIKKMKEIGTR